MKYGGATLPHKSFLSKLFSHGITGNLGIIVSALLSGFQTAPSHLEHVGAAVVRVLHHYRLSPRQRVGDAVLLLVADGLQEQSQA